MNELIKITNQIADCNNKEVAKQIMCVCRAITPAFYKNMSVEEIKAEKASIELLTLDIDQQTLSEMCKRAVLNYPYARSQNSKTFFDINYILQFYQEAFNFVHCYNIKLSRKAIKISSHYDEAKKILWQKWEDKGQEITIAIIQDKQAGNQYSPKDFELLMTDIDTIKFD